jgi:hypothetical protein
MSANVRQTPPGFLREQQSEPSGIRDVVYFPETEELRVTFASGRIFAYYDVPQRIYDAYMASPSPGAFFNIAIRGRFQFHELTPFRHPSRH